MNKNVEISQERSRCYCRLLFPVVDPFFHIATSKSRRRTMPSRKKSQGKARMAAKAEKKRQEQEQREHIDDVNHPPAEEQRDDTEICKHGYVPLEAGHVCWKMAAKFLKAADDAQKRGSNNILAAATCAVMEEFEDVFEDSDKLGWLVSYFVYRSTNHILNGKDNDARWCASVARYFEFVRAESSHLLHGTKRMSQCVSKIGELRSADEHTLVKFIRHRITCTCLDDRYKQVKSITKMGLCVNAQCSLPGRKVERKTMMHCSRCCLVNYCSRECQVADWPTHKTMCDRYLQNYAAARAEVAATKHDFNKAKAEMIAAQLD